MIVDRWLFEVSGQPNISPDRLLHEIKPKKISISSIKPRAMSYALSPLAGMRLYRINE